MRWLLIFPALLLLWNCGRGSSDYLEGGAPATSPTSTSPASSTTSATNPNVAPVAPALQSPVPADGACVTTPGQIVSLTTHPAEFIAVDSAYVYLNDHLAILRVPLAGGALEAVSSTDAGLGSFGTFDMAAGAMVFATDSETLGKIPVSGDATAGPAFNAFSEDYPPVAFDGLNLYALVEGTGATDDGGGPEITIVQIPIDGSATISTVIPGFSHVMAMVAGSDGLYAATFVNPYGGTETGAIVKVARGGGVTTLVANAGIPESIAVDDTFVYYGGSPDGSDTNGGIYRVGLDGSNPSLWLPTPTPGHLALDAHSIYFSTESELQKADKTSGAVTFITAVPLGVGLLVAGGNIFWAVGTTGLSSPAGVFTTCK